MSEMEMMIEPFLTEKLAPLQSKLESLAQAFYLTALKLEAVNYLVMNAVDNGYFGPGLEAAAVEAKAQNAAGVPLDLSKLPFSVYEGSD